MLTVPVDGDVGLWFSLGKGKRKVTDVGLLVLEDGQVGGFKVSVTGRYEASLLRIH